MGQRISAKVINAFLAPALEHLRTLAGTNTLLEKMELTQWLPPSSITVRIELQGGVKGTTYWSFDLALAEHLAKNMLPSQNSNQKITNLDILSDAVAELANIIVGHATGNLLESGYRIHFLPPCPIPCEKLSFNDATLNLVVFTPAGRAQILFQVQTA
jgi:CheY-specific phosphatase CheX